MVMRHSLVSGFVVLLMCSVLAQHADAARRSLRIDFGNEWGFGEPCDPGLLSGKLLTWRGYTFSGYAPLVLQNNYCQYAAGLAASNMFAPEDAPVKNLLKPGETISAARFWFLSGASNFPTEGDQGFQWAFFHFDDAIVVGLNGPVEIDGNFEGQPLPVTAVSSYLKASDGSTLWDGAAFDGEYLCFRPDGSFIGAVSAANLASCRQGVSRLPLLLSLPDTNSSGSADVAVLRGPAPIVAEILEGNGGAPVRTIAFFGTGTEFSVRAAVVLPDTDNNAIAELAVLATRNSDGRGYVQVRNLQVLRCRAPSRSTPDSRRSISPRPAMPMTTASRTWACWSGATAMAEASC
jgi:hypothetical protein